MTDLAGAVVLVTGGGGFIGSRIADALVGTTDVRVLDNFSSGIRANVPSEADVIEGDVTDRPTVEQAMEDVDIVFHEAAQVGVPKSVEDPLASHATNVDGTLAVLDAAREAGARTVLASSAAVYGAPDRVPITEDDRLDPTSPYGIDKLSVDHYARTFDSLYDQETVPLRYFNAYGPRGAGGDYSGVISIFLEQARAGGPITIHGDGSQTRDFVHVDDVVEANLLAATTEHTGEAYNVASGTSVTIRGLAELCRRLTGSDAEIVHTDARPGDIEHSAASIEKAQARLGFDPEVSLEAGLTDLLKSQ